LLLVFAPLLFQHTTLNSGVMLFAEHLQRQKTLSGVLLSTEHLQWQKRTPEIFVLKFSAVNRIF
jgi:hypothetical protein